MTWARLILLRKATAAEPIDGAGEARAPFSDLGAGRAADQHPPSADQYEAAEAEEQEVRIEPAIQR